MTDSGSNELNDTSNLVTWDVHSGFEEPLTIAQRAMAQEVAQQQTRLAHAKAVAEEAYEQTIAYVDIANQAVHDEMARLGELLYWQSMIEGPNPDQTIANDLADYYRDSTDDSEA